MSQQITIGNRKYAVAKVEDMNCYTLTGPRGAVYFTVRNQHNPNRMFLFNAKQHTNCPQVWLTDENGTLELV